MDLHALLRAQVKLKASDLHLTSGKKPRLRGPEGGLYEIEEAENISEETMKKMALQMVSEKDMAYFEEFLEYDGSYELKGEGRFRLNFFYDSHGMNMVLRFIPEVLHSIEDLGLPKALYRFTEGVSGIFLVTGQGNSGKSTTLASLIETMNQNYPYHIVTIEDPVEYRFTSKKSLIHQRNVGKDTQSFKNALKYSLRQNPDVIVVGEMRDRESMEAALTLAETGHLVIATLHTQKASSTIERIINSFPGDQHNQIRMQLAISLQGVLCQQLVPKKDRSGRVLAYEFMIVTPPIRSHIKEGSFAQMYDVIQSNSGMGMQTFEMSLLDLYKKGLISKEEVLFRVDYPEDIQDQLV